MSLPDDFEIRVGDALDRLRDIPDESIHCCVTSPPYWGLRDYGVEGQLGLEPTPQEYVRNLCNILEQVKRVLRPDGTLWLNIGDTYASDKAGTKPPENSWEADDVSDRKNRRIQAGNTANRNASNIGLKGKDLVGIPWRVAFAMQDRGWWLRQDNIWYKPNPMPESVTDRTTRSHEYVFQFAKSKYYYYDHEAIKEQASGRDPGNVSHKHSRDGEGKVLGRKTNPNAGLVGMGAVSKRNKRSVWEVTSKPFPEAHFAVYPEELIVPCVLAGTSEKGACVDCGAPKRRIVEKERSFESGSGKAGNIPEGKHGAGHQGGGETLDVRRGPVVKSQTAGWEPTCDCEAEFEPCIVVDPFCGAGTTGVVCTKLGRRFIGIELNDEYAEMARGRINDTNLSLF